MLLLKNLLFTLVVPGTVAGYVPYLLAGSMGTHLPILQLGAIVPFAVGILIYGWCVWDFATFGRGTPAPIDAPRRLVVRGLYRIFRNPMYVGVLAIISGWAMFYGSLLIAAYGAMVWTLFHTMVVLHEEPSLRKKFGAEYMRYLSQVHRWLPSSGR